MGFIVPKTNSQKYPGKKIIVFSELDRDNKNWFAFYPDQITKLDLVKDLGIVSLNKFRFNGYLESSGKFDWVLTCFLKCRIVHECRLTLKPFPMSFNTRISRKFVSNPKLLSPQEDNSIPEDETLELLTPSFALYDLVRETLFLELPEFPTKSGSDFDSSVNDDVQMPETEVADNPFSALIRSNS